MLRVLCLHGCRQTAEIFENQLSKLRASLEDIATLDFIDAPHVLPLLHAEDAVQTRSWCRRGGAGPAEADAGADEEEAVSSSADYGEGDRVVDNAMTAHLASKTAGYDVLLGFSQGALMVERYVLRSQASRGGDGGAASPLPAVKGVVLASSPDPRRVFAGSALWSDPASPPRDVLGDLLSLHIMGRKDAIVPPEESIRFAEACGPQAERLMHEHGHSVPPLRDVLRAVRSLCERCCESAAEVGALVEARAGELEMITSMYGEECVRRSPTLPGDLVCLPLLSDVESIAGLSSEVAAALEQLQLQFYVPPRYPAVLPELDVVRGPSWHSVPFARWKSEIILQTMAYLREDVELGGAALLPGFLFAAEQAAQDVDRLLEIYAQKPNSNEPAAAKDDAESAAYEEALEWAREERDEAFRNELIATAEADAVRLLKAGAKPKSHTNNHHHTNNKKTTDAEAGGGVEGDTTGNVKQQRGSWTLTIGLIGKPSAGKSTFFNAITNPESESAAARVAAFPFTTIEPNVGTGFGPVYCPCATLPPRSARHGDSGELLAGFASCDAAYGHVPVRGHQCQRRHPILVKDVAGLVQGAYQGKGKGNQFLNDLCDADVLVHVVDGAAATEADGTSCTPGEGSTVQDITWVRAEVHGWIYDNLRAKWSVLRRQPLKLRTMFSGYRSSPSVVDTALQRMNITSELALRLSVPTWGPRELHQLVALYTHLRFPMIVALNKADVGTAAELVATLRARYPEEEFVPMSAKTEWDLLQLRHKGLIHYLSGERHFECTEAARGIRNKADAARLQHAQDFFAHRVAREDAGVGENKTDAAASPSSASLLTSTGVQDVIAVALARCAAVLVFPVSTYQPAIPSLKNCFSFKHGTTAEDIFWAMTYAKLLDGKLVRFEVADATRREREVSVLRKTDTMPAKAVFVHVLSNKRQMS